jgi:hypothetical protein
MLFTTRTHLAALVLLLAACSAGTSTSTSDDAGGEGDASGNDAQVLHDDAGTDATRDASGPSLGVACSGASPSFATDVGPILRRSCSGGEICHSGILSNPWSYAALLNTPATRDCPNAGPRVTPSDLEKSYLIRKLTGVGMCPGTERMPRGGAPLPTGEIQTIADWICAGAKDN